MPKTDLSPRQRRFVAALMSARTVEEAAQAVGIVERTAYRYLADPRVRRALSEVLDTVLVEASGQAVRAMTGALATLEAIHTDEAAPLGARVSAARAILDAGPRLHEAQDLGARVSALEHLAEMEKTRR